MNTSSILHPLVLFVCFFVFFSQAQADQITLHPVQSGLVSDGSCCSPYAYSDNSAPTLLLTGCFDSTYGCGYRKDYGAWRWDVAGSIPEGAHIQSAFLRWNHPVDCFTFSTVRQVAPRNTIRDAYNSPALAAYFFASAAAVASALYVYMASLKKEGLCS